MVAPFAAWAQAPAVIGDLAAHSPVTLSKAELEGLLPGAKMSRTAATGSEHIWTNDPDGSFIVSSDKRNSGGRAGTGRGKWHVSEDGRFCVHIEWKASSDKWCRFIVKTDIGYFATKSLQPDTEPVFKLEISK